MTKRSITCGAVFALLLATGSNAATVTGKVVFTGTKPVVRSLDMSANPACQRAHSTPAKTETAILNSNGTLRYSVVWIKSGLPNKAWPAPTEHAAIEQQGCMYKPHVLAVMTNQPIDIKNDDPTNHNIHPLPKINQEWNESQPPKGDTKTKSFPREEVAIPVKCNVHPWMRAYIAVVHHPFFAVTGEDGTFTIKNLPAGTYTLEAWHETYGTVDQQITVGANDSKTIDLTYKK
jgi:hypothetical protein